jgi:hypothetical protein
VLEKQGFAEVQRAETRWLCELGQKPTFRESATVKRYDSVDMADAMRRRYFLACGTMLALLFYRPMFGQVLQSAGCSVDLELLRLQAAPL